MRHFIERLLYLYVFIGSSPVFLIGIGCWTISTLFRVMSTRVVNVYLNVDFREDF